MLDLLKEVLDEYQRIYRHPNLPPFKCSELYALSPEEGAPLASSHWDATWPNFDRAGVYLIFSKAGKLLYVGKARVIGNRLSSYFQYERPRSKANACRIVHAWQEPPMYVVTVAVPDTSPFEAAALEEFLIMRLSPPENTTGLRDTR